MSSRLPSLSFFPFFLKYWCLLVKMARPMCTLHMPTVYVPFARVQPLMMPFGPACALSAPMRWGLKLNKGPSFGGGGSKSSRGVNSAASKGVMCSWGFPGRGTASGIPFASLKLKPSPFEALFASTPGKARKLGPPVVPLRTLWTLTDSHRLSQTLWGVCTEESHGHP